MPNTGFSSIQSLSRVRLLQPHESQHARPPCPSPTPSLLKLMCIKSVMPSSHLILCQPLLLLPPIPPSIRVFSSESTLHMRCPKYWSFSFSIIPSREHPGLIFFRMDLVIAKAPTPGSWLSCHVSFHITLFSLLTLENWSSESTFEVLTWSGNLFSPCT